MIRTAVGYPILDPLAAGDSLLILREGGSVVAENVRYLTGAAPPMVVRRRIRAIARSHPAVRDVHDIRTHYVGPEIEVELRVKIADGSTVEKSQAIETELMEKISGLENVHHVHVHFEPASAPKTVDEPIESIAEYEETT